jgi:hypothetical protein
MKYLFLILILLCTPLAGADELDNLTKSIDVALQKTETDNYYIEGGDRGKILRKLNGYGMGRVGFRPVITVLPQGAWFSVNAAVVSADRRYVRIGITPFFSVVGAVDTFNFGR